MNTLDVRDRLLQFITSYILYNESIDTLDFDASLIDGGYIDSIGIIMLVTFMEEELKIHVCDHEIVPENFGTLNCMLDYVNRKSVNDQVGD